MKPPETRYSDYDRFAWFYNRYWGSSSYIDMVITILDDLLLSNLSVDSRILDLCCGTGQVAHALMTRGFQVTGVDGSEEMLRYARENAPPAEFILADARDFSLADTYNAAISTYDSLNHIMGIWELVTVFQNVRNVLVEDGLFLFDMNVEEGYLVRWQGDRSVSFVEDDNACIARASYDPEEKVGRSDITMFRLEDEVWRRSDVALFQRAYSEGEVRMALSKAGFSGIAAYDAVKDLGIAGNIGRIFFLAHKY